MSTDQLPEDWRILRTWLPADLSVGAREHGFLNRARGLQDAEVWLRLFLMHVVGGLSLQQTTVRAGELGLAKISSVALFKRLRTAEPWLRWLCSQLLEEQRRRLGLEQWPWRKCLRVIDATDVQEPGSTGTKLRLHYSIQVPSLACDHCEVTDHYGGEQFGRFGFGPGQWVLADRGYSHRRGVAHVLSMGAEVVVRWNAAIFPLEDAKGSRFNPLQWVKKLPVGKAAEIGLFFRNAEQRFAVRLCAIRKSNLATERTLRKMADKARRNGIKEMNATSKELAGYTLILTTIANEELSTEGVMEIYRHRWQIELYFKRLKSLLDAGHVPKSNDASAKGWMQAKTLSALLLERIMLEAGLFSPWGYRLREEPVGTVCGGA
jgi:hypothetical protein